MMMLIAALQQAWKVIPTVTYKPASSKIPRELLARLSDYARWLSGLAANKQRTRPLHQSRQA